MPSSPASEEPQERPGPREDAPARVEVEPQAEGAPGGPPPAERARELEAEVAALEDRYKRALADLDNYRKRTAREIERRVAEWRDRKSTRLNSSHANISYAVFCLKKKKKKDE